MLGKPLQHALADPASSGLIAFTTGIVCWCWCAALLLPCYPDRAVQSCWRHQVPGGLAESRGLERGSSVLHGCGVCKRAQQVHRGCHAGETHSLSTLQVSVREVLPVPFCQCPSACTECLSSFRRRGSAQQEIVLISILSIAAPQRDQPSQQQLHAVMPSERQVGTLSLLPS